MEVINNVASRHVPIMLHHSHLGRNRLRVGGELLMAKNGKKWLDFLFGTEGLSALSLVPFSTLAPRMVIRLKGFSGGAGATVNHKFILCSCDDADDVETLEEAKEAMLLHWDNGGNNVVVRLQMTGCKCQKSRGEHVWNGVKCLMLSRFRWVEEKEDQFTSILPSSFSIKYHCFHSYRAILHYIANKMKRLCLSSSHHMFFF